ncbi:MAG: type II toxin-antitoxin system PrlF family antitoxin [Bryobacteraceae bacterium]
MESALSIKGQATIPKAIRDHLHLEPGDRIKFFVHPDGSVVILPKIPTSKLKGVVKVGRRASLNDMETAIGEGAMSRMQSARRR